MPQPEDFKRLARQMNGRETWRGSLLLGIILLFCLLFGIWAAHAEIDTVTRATGQIVPGQSLQTVQATETGILRAVHVVEGDIVEDGQVLVALDALDLSSAHEQAQQRAYGLMSKIARLEAEINDAQLDFPEGLSMKAPNLVAAETALFDARRRELALELRVLDHQRRQRDTQIAAAERALQSAGAKLDILTDEQARLEPLAQSQLVPRSALLELRLREVEWRGRVAQAQAQLEHRRAALAEIDAQISALGARHRAAALLDLSQTKAELSALAPRLPALQDRAARAVLHAPVRGVVNRVHRNTRGARISEGDELIEIVPLDDTLLVEAMLSPSDIAFIAPGQLAQVTITAFDVMRFGRLAGEVIHIAASAAPRSSHDPEEGFAIRVRTTGMFQDAHGQPLAVLPGMVAEVDIQTDRKTVLSYLTSPLTRIGMRALRE